MELFYKTKYMTSKKILTENYFIKCKYSQQVNTEILQVSITANTVTV